MIPAIVQPTALEAFAEQQKFEVVVATQADGSDARLYAGRCIIDIRYEVRGSSKPYEVKSPQPDSDGEAEAQP